MATCPRCGTANPEAAKFCLECGTALTSEGRGRRESRRVVTILFSDLVGSTAMGEALDPETVRSVLERYFDTMRAILERHGGTVEKFIGDAIMAVFGLGQVHEDDALRAVRAAVEMRTTLAEMNRELQATVGLAIAARTGINTGEVVAGDASMQQPLVTGDAVNTAARLEQGAGSGEILIGRTTWQLVRHSVTTEDAEAIGAKGKAQPVPAYRVVSVAAEGTGRTSPVEGPRFVGRKRELARLRRALDRVIQRREPAVVTVLGSAGIGKSRLVTAFVATAVGRATVLRGRCLPYGDGITYWPLRELLHAAAGIREGDAPLEARRRLESLTEDLPDGPVLTRCLASAIGLTSEAASTDEIFWAARRTFEHLARSRPLVLVVEDLHWAEPTFLELLDHVAEFARDVPLLVVCPARPELLDDVPDWGARGSGRTTIRLEGLGPELAGGLADAVAAGVAIPADLRARIVATAEGNPLFVEEMIRMVAEELATTDAGTPPHRRTAQIEIPPTIHALMAARVDRLPGRERSVAERGSVAGRIFEHQAVVSLSPQQEQDDVTDALRALVRKELIAPEPSDLAPGGAFKFRHILIRDAAYDRLPKSERAELHERFADWLEQVAGPRVAEYQEILGYHLAEGHRYRQELRETSARTAGLALRAARHLHAAGKRARDRGDSAGAAELLLRAAGLPLDDQTLRAEVSLEAGHALWDLDRLAEARAQAELSLELAADVGERRLSARARILRLDISIADGTLVDLDVAAAAEASAALRDADASGDAFAIGQVHRTLGIQAYSAGRQEEWTQHTRTMLNQARASGDTLFALEAEGDLLTDAVVGPTTAVEALALAEALLDRAAGYPTIVADIHRLMAIVEAMLGRFDEARAHADQSIEARQQLGQVGWLMYARGDKAWVERLAGDLGSAERELRLAFAGAVKGGDRSGRSWVACRLAQVLIEQGRLEDAAPFVEEAEQVPMVTNRTRVVGARARFLAARGDSGAGELIASLLEMLADNPFPNVRIDGFVDAAEASALLGDPAAAARYAEQALRIARAKGNIARAAQIEEILERVGLSSVGATRKGNPS